MGQTTFVAIALCALGLLAPFGTLWFTAAALLEIVPLLAASSLVREPRHRVHLLAAAGAMVLLSLPYFLAHPDQFRYFARLNLRTPGGLDGGNHGAVNLAWRLSNDMRVQVVTRHWPGFCLLLRVFVLGITATVVLGSRDRAVVRGSATMLLAHFVSYPHVWEHRMSAVIMLGLLLLVEGTGSRGAAALLTTCVVLLALPSPFALFDTARDARVWDPTPAWPPWQRYAILLPRAVPALALRLAGMAQMRHVVREDQLGAVRGVAELVAENCEIRPVLDEAPPVVADRDAQPHAKQDSVIGPVRDHENSALPLGLCLGFGDRAAGAPGIGRTARRTIRGRQFGGQHVDEEAQRPRRDIVAALPARRVRSRGVVLPVSPQLRIARLYLRGRQAFPAPVVQFTQPFVHLDRSAGRDRLRGFESPSHRAGHDSIDSNARQPPRQRLRLLAPVGCERHVQLPSEDDVARRGLAVTGQKEGEHGRSVWDAQSTSTSTSVVMRQSRLETGAYSESLEGL